MTLSLAEIQHVTREIDPLLVGGRLENAAQVGRTRLVLTFYAQRAKHHLLLEANPQFARIHLTSERPPGTGAVPPFARSVRQALRGMVLTGIEVVGGDRIVELSFGRTDSPAGRLVAELTGRTSNLYHLGPAGRIVAVLRPVHKSDRGLRPGSPYEPPEPRPAPPAMAADRFADAAPASAAIERLYAEAETEERVRTLRASLTAHIRTARKRTQRLLDNLQSDMAQPEDAEHLRLCGELLKLNLGQIRPRQRSIALPDIFADGSPDVEIDLLPSLSAQGNMQRYFHRYKKLVAARRQGEARLAAASERLDLLDTKAVEVQAAMTLDDLEAVAAILGYRTGAAPQRRRPAPASGPHRFLSAEGMEILVGRTAAENDEITFRLAKGNDLWLHVEGYTGSHVVVRVPKGKTVPRETLLDAAALAVHFSQLRRAGAGPVVYCACKYVKKPHGAPAGSVLYSQSKTLHIEVDRSRLERLMGGGTGQRDSGKPKTA